MASKASYYPNPNNDFVLFGSPPVYTKQSQGYFSKSMLTDTTKNLSQHEKYGSNPQLRRSLHAMSCISGDITKPLGEANDVPISHFDNKLSQTSLNHPSSQIMSHVEWYTKPIHLKSSVKIPMDEEDLLAARYFPITLGETRSLEMVQALKPGKRLSKAETEGKLNSKNEISRIHSENPHRHHRSNDDAYFLTAFAPHIKRANISFTSPYSDDIAKLRMEKLRIEEQQYLELKRQAELERIRGPKPKWYELKTPEFHTEANKNTQLLRNINDWDNLLKYRESLVSATNRLKSALRDYEVPVY
ncbi:unnamed protein product [Lymnaea stagnalis]|uniref:Enkurin domain-containing protein n=1 Tax=Lymnaea stagnalis TaxID=6523 RepID=A0AAV2HGE2_LYMST